MTARSNAWSCSAFRVRTEQRHRVVEPGSTVDCLLSGTVHELQAAVAELREMTQGMLPAALTSGGAAPALREFVARHDGHVHLVACRSSPRRGTDGGDGVVRGQ